MIEDFIKNYLKQFDFDIRKIRDARFMDQKITPDVLSIIADCVINYNADRNIEFTKDNIWGDEYFITKIKGIFKKPDARNETTKREYDKFISQPLRMLAYAKVIEMRKVKGINYYKIVNMPLLEIIATGERNACIFLYYYLLQVLLNSGQLKFFEHFKSQCEKRVNNLEEEFQILKCRFQEFIIGNTPINGITEVNRIFPKILNIYSYHNNIKGTIKGKLSKRDIYYHDLMYNKTNFRDVNKEKNISRKEATTESKAIDVVNENYVEYQILKAVKIIRKMYDESELRDEWSRGEATHIHHIFPKTEFPELANYLENLIKLTPTQHLTKAHPNNHTQQIDTDYQLTCLLAKADSIEKSLRKGEMVYRKESFIRVINTGLRANIDVNLDFKDIKKELIKNNENK